MEKEKAKKLNVVECLEMWLVSKVTIDFLVRHYSCYAVLFFVDMEDKFPIGTFGEIDRMLIMVYGTVL